MHVKNLSPTSAFPSRKLLLGSLQKRVRVLSLKHIRQVASTGFDKVYQIPHHDAQFIESRWDFGQKLSSTTSNHTFVSKFVVDSAFGFMFFPLTNGSWPTIILNVISIHSNAKYRWHLSQHSFPGSSGIESLICSSDSQRWTKLALE